MTTTYLIYPRVLKGFEIDIWQANHRGRVYLRANTGDRTDGIIPRQFELLEEEDI